MYYYPWPGPTRDFRVHNSKLILPLASPGSLKAQRFNACDRREPLKIIQVPSSKTRFVQVE